MNPPNPERIADDGIIRKHGKVWCYSFTDADGKKWERKGCTDRRVTERTAEMLRVDLEAAGIAYETA
jgi:hypothetical protein